MIFEQIVDSRRIDCRIGQQRKIGAGGSTPSPFEHLNVFEIKIQIVSQRFQIYFSSTVAPASANFFLIVSASSLLTPSLTVLGAPSTRSLASFKPRLVTSLTTLMTFILLDPTFVKTTENSVFSSATAAVPDPPPPAAATTIEAAATAGTSKASSRPFA